jgi:hypothetical protein
MLPHQTQPPHHRRKSYRPEDYLPYRTHLTASCHVLDGCGAGAYPPPVPSSSDSELAATPVFIRTPSEFSAHVVAGTTPESLVLEFKEAVSGWNAPTDDVRRRAQKELCRDISQFANTRGGALLLGVAQRLEPSTGTSVAARVVPVSDIDKFIRWVEQAITNFLVPSTLSHEIVPVAVAPGPIVAVNVPASVHLVAVWDRQEHTIEYLYRTNHGKSWMNPDEAEAHMTSGSRAIRLMIEEAVAKSGSKEVEIVGPICAVGSSGGVDEAARLSPHETPTLVGLYDHHLEIKFHVHSSYQTLRVPLAAIRSAWPGEWRRTVLLLDGVRIVSRLGSLELVPS